MKEPDNLLAPSWRPLARFGKVRASILEVFGAQFLHNFQVFGSHFFSNFSPVLKHLLYYNLVRNGLAGLREAQRITPGALGVQKKNPL